VNLWIEGGSGTGKRERMIQQFGLWAEQDFCDRTNPQAASQTVLFLAIDSEQRRNFSDRLLLFTHGRYPITAATPLSFFQNEVRLYWTFLVKELGIKAQFPLVLRVENEQELAAQHWQQRLDGNLEMEGVGRDRLVRRMLDLLLLAANGGYAIESIPEMLTKGIDSTQAPLWQEIGAALQDWRKYCWEAGLLTYGIVADLFVQYLLPNPRYQEQLRRRFAYVMIDRADEMPAIIADLCRFLLDQGAEGVFSFNRNGSARLGLGADPDYWQQDIKPKCEVLHQPSATVVLGSQITDPCLDLLNNPTSYNFAEPYDQLHSIDSISRAKLFRNVAEVIAAAIESGTVKANEIAIIAPGLDNIAKYAIVEILHKKNINVFPLNDQRPLSQSAQVRSLLTLMLLGYPKLGHLLSRDHVAEMLVVLTEAIDPVRAGMLADSCFAPHPEMPQLLAADTFAQWNRLGYRATKAYEQLRQWRSEQSPQQTTPLLFLDRAIQKFFKPRKLNYEQTATLQKLIETAQHHWQLGQRLGDQEPVILEKFIQLIRQGIATADPYAPNLPDDGIILATIFQYRSARRSHRWQFWLDASSELWLQGGAAALFAAPIFLKGWHGEQWTMTDQQNTDMQRLQRLIADLLDRAGDRLYLCHSEFSTNGQTQNGILLPLIEVCRSIGI
jgi:hypothetical protein